MEVFWAHGFEGASISDLTRAMGIGRKSLYDTFGNKRSVFLRALESYSDSMISEIRCALMDTSTGPVLRKIRWLLRKWVEDHSQPCSKGCFIGTAIADFSTSDHEMAQALGRSLQKVEDVFTEAIAKAEENQEIRLRTTPRHLARALICLTQGIALVGRVMDSGAVLESALKVAELELLGGEETA